MSRGLGDVYKRQTLGSIEDVEKLAFGKNDYHFILCDKMVCELISKKVLPTNAYAIMAKKLTAFLHENGLLIMLDVTTKDEHSGYFYPQLTNLKSVVLKRVLKSQRLSSTITLLNSMMPSFRLFKTKTWRMSASYLDTMMK